MSLKKIFPWIGGVALIVAGSIELYYQSYRSNDLLDELLYLVIFSGWIIIITQVANIMSIDKNKIAYRDDKAGFVSQKIKSFIFYVVSVAIIFANIYYVGEAAGKRRQGILATMLSKTTIADVVRIEIQRSRNADYYHAIFQYTVNGQLVSYTWHEQKGDFQPGDRFLIRYSVQYPQMFKIIGRVRQTE